MQRIQRRALNAPPGTRRRGWLVALCILLALLLYLRLTHAPAHRDWPIAYSTHARLRMTQRSIWEREVEETIRRGEWRPGKVAGRFESVWDVPVASYTPAPRRIHVVFAIQKDHLLVISAMVEGS